MKKRKYYQERRAYADGWDVEVLKDGKWVIVFYPSFLPDIQYRIVPDSEGFLPFYPHSAALCPVDVDAECKYETDSPSWMASDNDECWEYGIRPFLYRPVQQKRKVVECFRVGKTYEHSGGGRMKIVGGVYTHTYGYTLIGEDEHRHLKPVGQDKTNAVNWYEVLDDGTTEEID